MKYTDKQRAYHQRVLQEVAEMIAPLKLDDHQIESPSSEVVQWANNKIKSLLRYN